MKRFLSRSLLFLALASPLRAQEAPEERAVIEVNRDAEVSILCYHDFTDQLPATVERIRTEVLRAQLETLREKGIAVIALSDFLAWRAGKKVIPSPAVVITIDDGWRTVYTDAFPVFREFGVPFSVFLYTSFVDTGRRSLTLGMIRELLQGQGEIGSHSYSHPYPSQIKAFRERGEEAFANFLEREMKSSKKWLEDNFGQPITAYAYPGGIHNDEITAYGLEIGYQALFTVNPARTPWDQQPGLINRFQIFGNDPSTFENAIGFRSLRVSERSPEEEKAPEGVPDLPSLLSPEPESVISSRQPLLQADLSACANLDPESLVMRVSGLGKVPVSFDPSSQLASYRVDRWLRHPDYTVFLYWKQRGAETWEEPITWGFSIDRQAHFSLKSEN
ncbi:MAG: polysaccharide deacetylase family protein [Verrucomicrobiota bacterium]